jgi:HAD superfamily hydrolase (TIGR01549 family)
VRAIIFDLDGTLFQTEKIVIPAFQKAFIWLKEQGKYHGKIPTEEEILAVTGDTIDHLWDRLLPNADIQVKETMNKKALEIELELLNKGKGELYPGVIDTLNQLLKEGWNLFIASNGLGPYVKGVLHAKGIDSLFTEIYAAGEAGTKSKVDLVYKCIEAHQITKGYMVGDRSSDVEAGKKNQLCVIGCQYANFPQFGEVDELKDADIKIKSINELLKVITP